MLITMAGGGRGKGKGILDNRIKASSFILTHSARRLVCRCQNPTSSIALPDFLGIEKKSWRNCDS